MRADLITTCDVIFGPGTATPGVIKATGPCRFVREQREIAGTTPVAQRVAYVTMDVTFPDGPFVTGGPVNYTSDYSQSDLIAIPSGNLPVYQVLFSEAVFAYAPGTYWRAHVRVIPGLAILLQEDMAPLLQEDTSWILIT